jgi:Bacterial HORMA domain 2
VTTATHVSVATRETTYITDKMIRSSRQLIEGTGLDPKLIDGKLSTIENGFRTWLQSRHLKSATVEVSHGGTLVGRFDFNVRYGYYRDDGWGLRHDQKTIEHVIQKNGEFSPSCSYRVIVAHHPGYPRVEGWTAATYKSTGGFQCVTVGSAIGGGIDDVSLSFWK